MNPNWIQKLLLTVPKDQILTIEQIERFLLNQLIRGEPNAETAMWELIRFYNLTGNLEAEFKYARSLLDLVNDPEKLAQVLVSLGVMMEKREDFPAAIAYYRQALPLEPSQNIVWYFVNNNLGYCLNILGEHSEAESYCRAAIEINPQRHNAYKNLGIARRGQEDAVGAAESFITATRIFPRDRRAYDHLVDLIESHPEIKTTMPDLQANVEQCRQWVEQARG